MKKTYVKLLWRGIRGTRARFISILAIVAVGSGILAGLLATTPDMQLTADRYYDANHFFDVDIRGTLGITEADAQAVRALDFVEDAMPCRVTDLNLQNAAGSYVTRIYGVPLDEYAKGGLINGFELLSGRMPQNAGECLITAPNGYTENHSLGEVYTISEDNKDADSLADTYAFTKLTVVGIVRCPYYMSVESEPSCVGTGRVGLVMFVYPQCYATDIYTDLFITIKGAAGMQSFSDEYSDFIAEASGKLETPGLERCKIRFDDVVSEATEKLKEAQGDYDEAKDKADRELAEARKKLDDGCAALEKARTEIAGKKKTLTAGLQSIAEAKARLSVQIETQKTNLESMRALLSDEQYAASLAEIQKAEAAGLAQIAERERSAAEAGAQIDAAERQIAQSESDLLAGETDYQSAKEEADEKLAEANSKIQSAKADIDAIETPEWYVTDRSDTVSFASYKSNTEKIAAIAKVFPIFFFLVAALVALTTMTRMVEEERPQIGILKALGYSDRSITAYYIGYSVLASLLGSFLGVAVGFATLPAVIANAYGMMYALPAAVTPFWWSETAAIVPIAVTCTTLATLFACVGQLSEKPAQVMLPRAPSAGKRILLERISPVWKRLSFIRKVTARNIFRYRKRFYMTVLGIAGCCALLVTGFGLRDSIRDIVGKQFGEIFRYDLAIYLKDGATAQNDETVAAFLADSAVVKHYATLHNEAGKAEKNGKSEKVTFYVPETADGLKQEICLRERIGGKPVDFGESSVVLTEKLCETLGVRVGDTVRLTDADGGSAEVKVTGIAENYISAFAFIGPSAYREAFGRTPDFRLVLAGLGDTSEQARDAVSREILGSGNVMMVQFTQTIRESFEHTVGSIDYIVVVLILSAGILAVIVLYNLTNINICERKKELATIKVLGFRDNEVASYIYRETSILCLIGTLLGFGFGIWLHSFVVRTAEVDAVMFGRTVYPQSFLFAALVTLGFTVLVDLIMLAKLKAISMVESMKANE